MYILVPAFFHVPYCLGSVLEKNQNYYCKKIDYYMIIIYSIFTWRYELHCYTKLSKAEVQQCGNTHNDASRHRISSGVQWPGVADTSRLE